MSHTRRQALHDKEVSDFLFDVEASAKRILKVHSRRREDANMREKARMRRAATAGSPKPGRARSLPTAPHSQPSLSSLGRTAPAPGSATSFVMDGGGRKAWETPSPGPATSTTLPPVADASASTSRQRKGRWPEKLKASPLMRTLSSSPGTRKHDSSAAAFKDTLSELGISDSSSSSASSSASAIAGKKLQSLSHSHNPDHMIERRMCHACMTDPGKLTQTENGLRSLAQNVRHGVELQGPTSWSSSDLRQKYRCEQERAKAYGAMESAMHEATLLEAEDGVVVPVATVDRHPLPVVYEKLLETVNMESQLETKRRNALKVFIFNVHDLWHTNLRHLRELQDTDADHAPLPAASGFSSAGSGKGLRGRRDVAAILDHASQVQSVSLQRAIAGGYYSTVEPVRLAPPPLVEEARAPQSSTLQPEVTYALENEPAVISGHPVLLTIATRTSAYPDEGPLIRVSAYHLATGCEPTVCLTEFEARKALAANKGYVARLRDSPMRVVARRCVGLAGRRFIIDVRVGQGVCGSVAVDFQGYCMHDDERGEDRHVLHATGREVLGVIAYMREADREDPDAAPLLVEAEAGGATAEGGPVVAAAAAEEEEDIDGGGGGGGGDDDDGDNELRQARLKRERQKAELAPRPLSWWLAPARASLWARIIKTLTFVPIHENYTQRDDDGLVVGQLRFPPEMLVLEPQKLLSVLQIATVGPRANPITTLDRYAVPELVVPSAQPADALQQRAAANSGRDWEKELIADVPELNRSLSFQVSGREDLADQVPGTADVGQLGLWFRYEQDVEHTQPVGLFFRDPLLSSSSSVMVVVDLALDTPLLAPYVTAWVPDPLAPKPAPHEAPPLHTPVVNPPPTSVSSEPVISDLDVRIPSTVVVLNGAAKEQDWLDTTGHLRLLPELTDKGFRRKATEVLQRPYRKVHPCVFGVTQHAAAPNAVATNGRQTWHSEEVTDQMLIRVRTPADYKSILTNSHSSSNEPQCFTLFLTHEEERAIVAVGISEYMNLQRKLAEDKARKEAEAEVQLRIEAANQLAQKKRRDRHRIERQLRKKELDRRRKHRGKDEASSLLHDWEQRVENSTVLVAWQEWEARLDNETSAIFYHCTDANAQEVSNQWDPPAEWPEDLIPEASPDNVTRATTATAVAGAEEPSSAVSAIVEDTPEKRTVSAMVDFLASNEGFLDALASRLGLVRLEEEEDEDESEQVVAERELEAQREASDAARVAAEDADEREASAMVPGRGLMHSGGGVLPRRSQLTLRADLDGPSSSAEGARMKRRRAKRRERKAREAAARGETAHQTVSQAVAQGGPNAAGTEDNLYGDHSMEHLPGEIDSSEDGWSDSGDSSQDEEEFNVLRRQVDDLNLNRVPALALKTRAQATAGAPLVRDWRRLKATRLPVGFVSKVKRPLPVRARETQLNTPNAAAVVGLVDAATATSYEVPYLQNTPPTLFIRDMVADLERVLAKQTHLSQAQRNVQVISYDDEAPGAGGGPMVASIIGQTGPSEDQKFEWVQKAVSNVKNGRVPELEAILDEGVPVDSRDEHGNTLLILAVQQGSKRMAKFCLKRGADINAQNLNGNTSLHYAKAYHFDEVFEYLVQKGADESVTNAVGYTCYEGLQQEDLEAL